MTLAIALLLLASVAAAYWIVRRRGAAISATYQEAGGGWAGVKAVLLGYKTLVVSAAGGVIAVLPDILTPLAGVDFKEILPEPWGVWVALALAIITPLIAASRTTPTGQPPAGEA